MAGKSVALIVLIAIGLVVPFGCGDDNGANPDNNPPVILSVTADPDTIYANQSTWVTVVAEDPDGDELYCSWDVHGLEMQGVSGTDRSIELQPGCDCLEEVTDVQILAIVTDSQQGQTRDSVKVVVLPSPEM
jgi:hypothetical protein